MIYQIILILLWYGYCVYEGSREAYYWHFANNTLKPLYIDVHPMFAHQRIIVACIICLINGFQLESLVIMIGLGLTFSFIHNGMYYITRNNIDKNVYPKRWWAQSNNSTAILTKVMTPISRTIQFVVGNVLLAYIIFK